jgi:hypothetical protein
MVIMLVINISNTVYTAVWLIRYYMYASVLYMYACFALLTRQVHGCGSKAAATTLMAL